MEFVPPSDVPPVGFPTGCSSLGDRQMPAILIGSVNAAVVCHLGVCATHALFNYALLFCVLALPAAACAVVVPEPGRKVFAGFALSVRAARVRVMSLFLPLRRALCRTALRLKQSVWSP